MGFNSFGHRVTVLLLAGFAAVWAAGCGGSMSQGGVTGGGVGGGGGASCSPAAETHGDYGAANGSGSSATVLVTAQAGQMIVFSAWCYHHCMSPSVVMDSVEATQTTVSGVGIDEPLPDPSTGQGFFFYILSAPSSGTFPATFNFSGADGGGQLAYYEFASGSGCKFRHHTDYPLGSSGNPTCDGSGTCATPLEPAFTATTGDLLVNFVYTSSHMTGENSPWTCAPYTGSGETQTCQYNTTVNETAYVLSSAGGATHTDMATLHPGGDIWESLVSSFSQVSSNP